MGIGILQAEQLKYDRGGRLARAAIVDARSHEQYLQGHIPGAIWIGWESWCEPAPRRAGPALAPSGYWGVLARASGQEYGHRLGSHGLCHDCPIVVYADGQRTRGREGRVAWMLLYLGASEVHLLDGGWSSWLARECEVQVGIESPERGHFTVRFQPERRRTLRTLLTRFRTGRLPVLVDARSRAEFDGENQEGLPRGGHLIGACLLPFADLFEPDGRYVEREQYMKTLPDEVRQATNIVTYCEVGVRAALLAMLHEAYTGQVVAVYDGSVMEWALAPDLPMSKTLSEPSQL